MGEGLLLPPQEVYPSRSRDPSGLDHAALTHFSFPALASLSVHINL